MEHGQARPEHREAIAAALGGLHAETGEAEGPRTALLFDRAAELLLRAAEDRREARRLCDAGAFADAAMLLHRRALPAFGFQFGQSAGAGPRGIASHWRRGEAYAHPYEAASPALALLRAAAFGAIDECKIEARARCARCCGMGWTIAADGTKRMCRHGREAG